MSFHDELNSILDHLADHRILDDHIEYNMAVNGLNALVNPFKDFKKIETDPLKGSPVILIPIAEKYMEIYEKKVKDCLKKLGEYNYPNKILKLVMPKISNLLSHGFDIVKKLLSGKDITLVKGYKLNVGFVNTYNLLVDLKDIYIDSKINIIEKWEKTGSAIAEFIIGMIFDKIGESCAEKLLPKLIPGLIREGRVCSIPFVKRIISSLIFGLITRGNTYSFAIIIIGLIIGYLLNLLYEKIKKVINSNEKKYAGIDVDFDLDGFSLLFGLLGLLKPPGGGGGDGGSPGGAGALALDPSEEYGIEGGPAVAYGNAVFHSGGIEFIMPREINKFKKNFSFNKCHYIPFEFSDENKDFDINQIIDLVNNKFLINNIKVKSLDEIYETILKEISYGFLYQKELPSISLNFNSDGLLYSIMYNYYKNTLTGNVLTFLDYYLKSYVNGGFFKEEFIYNWQNKRNENLDYLSQNLTDFKRYIFDLKKDPNNINYLSIYDLDLVVKYEKEYISAFRIIGNIENRLSFHKNLIFPKCFYFTQYDFDILPKWQAKINSLENEEDQIGALTLDEIHKIMANRVTILMNKIPFLRPYFELLKMITFAIHYLPNIQKAGLFPIFNKSIQSNYPENHYCRSIPKVFPPLPIRKTIILKVKFKYKEILYIFRNDNYKQLNEYLSIIFYENDNLDLNNIIEKFKPLFDKLKNYVRQRIKNSLNPEDKDVFELFSDEKMKIESVEKYFKVNLIAIPISYILKEYFEIYDILDKQEELYKPKNPKENILKIKNFNELQKEIDLIKTSFNNYILELENILNNEIIFHEKNEKIIFDKVRTILKKRYKNKNNEQLDLMILTDNNTQALITNTRDEMIKDEKKKFQIKKNIYMKLLENLDNSVKNLQEKFIFYNLINDFYINKSPIFELLNLNPFEVSLSYTKPTFRDKNNLGNNQDKYFPLRGGCFPTINNKLFLSELEDFDEKLYERFTNEKIINHENKNYYIIKTELRNGFIFGPKLEYLTKNLDINGIKMIFYSLLPNNKIPNNDKNLKDNYGNTLGHYKVMMSPKSDNILNNLTNTDLNNINNFSQSPELFCVALENERLLTKMLSMPNSNFQQKTEGGLTPLNLAFLNDSRNIINILLNKKNIKKIGSLNISNELGYTPLHLAVVNNNDTAVKILLDNGADISKTTRKQENTPIHLMAQYARNEIISNIYKDKKFISNLNKKRPDERTALHLMSSNSILGTKLLLLAGANKELLDKFLYTPAKCAYFTGRLDCYYLLSKQNKLKMDFKLIQDLDNLKYTKSNSVEINFNYKDNLDDEINLDNNNILDYENLVKNFEKNNIKKSKAIINNFNVELLEKDKIYKLIEISCKNRNIELFKLIAEKIRIREYHIGPFIGKYGLYLWLKEINNLGINIFTKSEDILNNKNIYDFMILNDDNELLNEIFKFSEIIPDDSINIISDIFCDALVKCKSRILNQIEKELNKKKYENKEISLDKLIKNSNTTLNMVKSVLNNFPKVNSKSIKAETLMKFSRPNILEYLIKREKMKEETSLTLSLKKIGLENNRLDNIYILFKNFPELNYNNENIDIINLEKQISDIENLLKENDGVNLLENNFKNKLNEILEHLDVGFLKFKNTYLPHLIIESKNFWAFECLKNKYQDIFFVDDENNTCFDYLRPMRDENGINFDNLKIICEFFDDNIKDILKVIEIYVKNNFNKDIDAKLIEFLLNTIFKDDQILDCYNENFNNIFHLIGCLKINSNSSKLIIDRLNNFKNNNLDNFNDLINFTNAQGNTFLMIFIKNKNYEISIDILDKFYENIQINSHNYFGNSILHILLMNKNFEKVANDRFNLERVYQLLLKILKKNKKLILSKNRINDTPFILAAISACNMAISIMLEMYDFRYLESFNENTTILHQACISNNINTVRFLIESFHYNPNIKLKNRGNKNIMGLAEGSTPLHAASVSSSVEIFEYLMLHGGDPFIQNIYKKDAIDVAFELGNKKFIKYILNLGISKRYLGNDKYLLSLVRNSNKDIINYFYEYCDLNTFENFNIVDEDMNTLLYLACKSNNEDIIQTLINCGINPLIQNKYGLTCLHICAYLNNYSCAGLILSKFESYENFDKLNQILTIKDFSGNTVLHIATEEGNEDFIFLIVNYLIRNDIKLELVNNNLGLTPLQLAIKLHNYNIALIFIKYLNIEYNIFSKNENKAIEENHKDFMYCYNWGLLEDNIKIIEEKIENIKYFDEKRKNLPELPEELKEYKKDFEEENKIMQNLNYNDLNEGVKIKSFCYIKLNLDIIHKHNKFNDEIFYKNQNLFCNMKFVFELFYWGKNKREDLIDKFFIILNQLFENKNKIIKSDNYYKENELYYLVEIICTTYLPNLDIKNSEIILDFLKDLIDNYQNKNLDMNNNLLKFIKCSIISYCNTPFIKVELSKFINELNTFIKLIINDEDFLKYFKYTSSAFQTHEMVFKFNIIFKILKDKNLQLCQIKNINKIPCLLNEEIPKLLDEYYILHDSIFIDNKIYDLNKLILIKENNNEKVKIINDILFITEKIEECHEIKETEKFIIIENIEIILEKYIISKNNYPNNISDFLINFFLYSKTIILNTNFENYQNEINEILDKSNSLDEIISALFKLSSPKELISDKNININLNNILSDNELDIDEESKIKLANIANLILKYSKEYKLIKKFDKIGIEIGKEFRQNPDEENLSKLLSLIGLGVMSVLNMRPYLIQYLIVSLFLLDYIDNDDFNKDKFTKGKLLQIKTGEGKSLIIAMLSLANALMGYFIDIITSNHYLARRDQIKFKKLFDEFGVSSSHIAKENPTKADYNGIILYGTNTDFEFSLLKENIYRKNNLFTVPLNSLDQTPIKREYNIAIIDECDNLFLDTAGNSARIAHPSKYHYNWMYPLIYNYYINNKNDELDIDTLREELLNYEKGKYSKDLERISDKRLEILLQSAEEAENKIKNTDYVIGYDEENNKKEIQIVSLDTGRIQHGTRWSNGIHEFVEVKEGIEPETENNVIGSISHPTYFSNYDYLFGVTGTIGDKIETDEIKKIYEIDCYKIPSNFKKQFIEEETEIYENKNDKFERILNIIDEIENSSEQPILVILENIEQTIELKIKLEKNNYKPLILNDIQKENEDFILKNSGHCKNILIATNAAGRGTDIIIDDEAKNVGGLFVIIGFFPRNSRIEDQAKGRAGRQGNPGKAKLIISRDELFIIDNYKYINKIINEENKNEIDALYLFREYSIKDISKIRLNCFQNEKINYSNLNMYFAFKKYFIDLLDEFNFRKCFDCLITCLEESIHYEYYKNYLLLKMDDIWSEYYSDFIKEKKKEYIDKETGNIHFYQFLKKFEKEWIEYLKDIYLDDYQHKIKADIIVIIIKSIIQKIKTYSSFKKNKNFNKGIFLSFLSSLKLEDLLN